MRSQNWIAGVILGCAASAMAQPGPDGPPRGGPPRDGQGPRHEERDRRPHAGRPGAALEKGAFLGVATSPASPAMREQLHLPVGTGLVVNLVEEGSPAGTAGLQKNDVIAKLDDQLLVNAQQLAALVRGHKAGDEVTLTIYRGGDTKTLKAKLVEKDVEPLEDMFFLHLGPRGAMMPMEGGAGGGVGVAGGGNMRPRMLGPFQVRPGETMSSTTVWTDDEHTLTITAGGNPPTRKLVATDKAGKELFNGNLDDKAARESMPPAVAEKLKRMEGAGIRPPRPDGPRGGRGPEGDRGPGREDGARPDDRRPPRPEDGRPPRPEGDRPPGAERRPDGPPDEGNAPPPPPGARTDAGADRLL